MTLLHLHIHHFNWFTLFKEISHLFVWTTKIQIESDPLNTKKRPMTFRSVWLPLGSTDTRINVIGATFSAAVTWPAFGVSQLVLCVEFIFWPVRVSVSKHFSRVGQIATWTACATHMGQRPIIFRSQKKKSMNLKIRWNKKLIRFSLKSVGSSPINEII